MFGRQQVMVILRGTGSPRAAVDAARRAWDAGVELVEVPIGQTGDAETLAAVVRAGRERDLDVGAGTVITAERVRVAQAAGAAYTVAPGFDPEVMAGSRAAGLPHLPGVATPGEVQRAWAAGCRWVKVFPAGTLGPAWFSAVRGPFPDVRLLATGGVTLRLARDYLAAGAAVVAFGASAVEPDRCAELAALVEELKAAESGDGDG